MQIFLSVKCCKADVCVGMFGESLSFCPTFIKKLSPSVLQQITHIFKLFVPMIPNQVSTLKIIGFYQIQSKECQSQGRQWGHCLKIYLLFPCYIDEAWDNYPLLSIFRAGLHSLVFRSSCWNSCTSTCSV